MNHMTFLDLAYEEATQSVAVSGRPVGAVLVKNNQVVAKSHDRTNQLNDPIAVAELDCIRRAGRRIDQRELTLYTTRYPDLLCAGTVLQFSIGEIVIGLEAAENEAIKLLNSKHVPITFMPHPHCQAIDVEDSR